MHEIFCFSTSRSSGFLKEPSKHGSSAPSLFQQLFLGLLSSHRSPWVPQTPIWSWSHLHLGEGEAHVRAHCLSRSRPRHTAPSVSRDGRALGPRCWDVWRHRKARLPATRTISADAQRPPERMPGNERSPGRAAGSARLRHSLRLSSQRRSSEVGEGRTCGCSGSRLWGRVADSGGRQAAPRQLRGPPQGSRPTPLQFVQGVCRAFAPLRPGGLVTAAASCLS